MPIIYQLRCLSFRPPRAGFPFGYEVFNVPEPICGACRHRGINAQCAVNPDELPKRESGHVALDLL